MSRQRYQSVELFKWHDGFAYIEYDKDADEVTVRGCCSVKSAFDSTLNNISKYLEDNLSTYGKIYTLVKTSYGYELRKLGKVDTEFQEVNYYDQTVKDYKHILNCLSSKDPCGRLTIMEGPPGTGKSYLIRSLVSSLNATFVFVPASILGNLTGPELVPAILNESTAEHPIVLILEDADVALVARERDGNLSKLSEVLNIGDGIFGQLLDIRIIATTNSSYTKFDTAITRPGRLCRHVVTGPLEAIKIQKILETLGSNVKWRKESNGTLADVYRKARDSGWNPESSKVSAGQYL